MRYSSIVTASNTSLTEKLYVSITRGCPIRSVADVFITIWGASLIISSPVCGGWGEVWGQE